MPVVRAFFEDDHLIADNFCGGGGASLGIEWALGRSPDVAVNHDAEAIAMHRANHPATTHYNESVWEIDPRKVCKGRTVGLCWLSPDCFPAGTMVLTRRGYEPIESIRVGTEVLTHRGRWRRVTQLHRSSRPLVRVRGQGHPGLLVSPEHPFYARTSKQGGNEWIKASSLGKGCYWSSPVEFPACAVPSVASHRARSMTITSDLMWLAGRYVADGWSRLDQRHAELVITCGKHEVDGLREIFKRWDSGGARAGTDELAWTERAIPGANGSGSYQFATAHRGLVGWLREHFGHGSAHKSFPSWALGMERMLRESLLEGYVSGDGHTADRSGKEITVTTVSKALAFSAKALAASLGHTVGIYLKEKNNSVIQGRVVNTLPCYSLRWRPDLSREHTVRDGHLEFAPVRAREDGVAVDTEVFNIAVDEDESYVVEGIVVHNCTSHSNAKGGEPRDQKIRCLAWIAITWAKRVKPLVFALENVMEWLKWGPLHREHTDPKCQGTHCKVRKGKPCRRCKGKGCCLRSCRKNKPIKAREGETFRAWKRKLESYGYVMEWRLLRACDYGAPTKRRRLFLVARRDGQPIVWPKPTHGPVKFLDQPANGPFVDSVPLEQPLKPYRTIAECVDWSRPCPSIFDRERPLADKTLARIARGIDKFVLNAARPFVVPTNHGGADPGQRTRCHSIDEPMPAITGQCRGSHALVQPTLVRTTQNDADAVAPVVMKAKTYGGGGNNATSPEEPIGAITGSKRGEFAIAVPYLVHRSNGERPGQAPRIYDPQEPLGTIVAQGEKHAACLAFLAKHFGGNYDKGNGAGESVEGPMGAITSRDHHSLVAAHVVKFQGTSNAHIDASSSSMEEPAPAITAQGLKLAQVAAFLVRYNGTGTAENANEPIGALTSKDRFGLVTVTIDGEEYVIVDIGMRMLDADELYLAQGFPPNYRIAPEIEKKTRSGKVKKVPLTKTAQVRMVGNSVSPPVAAAIIRANLPVRAAA